MTPDIERLAREADPGFGGEPEEWADHIIGHEAIERFAALVRAAALEDFSVVIRKEIDHAATNDHRLSPAFGKSQGDPAVRSAYLEAALDALKDKP